MEITYDELNLMKESYCEACKGLFWIEETRCYEICEGFLEELETSRKEAS